MIIIVLFCTDGMSDPEYLYTEVVSHGVFTLEELKEMRKSCRIECSSKISPDDEG